MTPATLADRAFAQRLDHNYLFVNSMIIGSMRPRERTIARFVIECSQLFRTTAYRTTFSGGCVHGDICKKRAERALYSGAKREAPEQVRTKALSSNTISHVMSDGDCGSEANEVAQAAIF